MTDLVGPTMEELLELVEDDEFLPCELGGVFLGYAAPFTRGLLCYQCATWEDPDDLTPHVVNGEFRCVACGMPSGDVVLEENDDGESDWDNPDGIDECL